MKKLFLVGFIVVSSFPVWATPTQADLRQLEQQIQREQKAGEVSGRKAAELSGEVKTVQKQMVQLAKTVQEKEDDLTRLEKRNQQMQERQKDLEQRLNLTSKQIVQLVTGLQTLSLRPPELAFINAHTPIDMLRSRMVMGYSLPVVHEMNQQVRDDLAELSRLKVDIQEQIVRIKSTRMQLSEQSTQMDRLLQQKSILQAQYQESQKQSQNKVKTLGAQAKDLKDLLDKLAREKRQVVSRPVEEKQKTSIFQKSTPYIQNAFVRAKGRLPYPVRGSITGYFGDETLGGGHSKGLTITGRSSARVIAPFDGTVLFAGPFKTYGELIIIDHGDNYLTLLAGMESVDTSVGQEVLAGEPIGSLKDFKPELYIEIRQDGQAIDPAPWFAK